MAIKQITPQEAFDMATKGTLFVDVREKNETDALKYDLKNIIYLPMSEIEKKLMALLPVDKNIDIILACRSGGRSMLAAGILEQNGYQNLYNLNGGIMGWGASSLPCIEK